MSKTRKCMFCNNIETPDRLFIQCSFTKPVNRADLYLLRLSLDRDVSLSLKWFKVFMLMLRLIYTKYVTLVLLSESRYIIRLYRNEVKVNKSLVSIHDLIGHFLNKIHFRTRLDYTRLSTFAFTSFWEDDCKIKNDSLVYLTVLNINSYVTYCLHFCQLFHTSVCVNNAFY